jgi:hypothetical protein
MTQFDNIKHHVSVRVREFGIPPVHDGLVLGRHSPIGCTALRRALNLLAANTFEHIEIEDEVISDILVRAAILQRLPREKLVEFVLEHIKLLMSPYDVVHIDLMVEVMLEGVV